MLFAIFQFHAMSAQDGRASRDQRRMIDNFSILLSHALILLAFWFLTQRDDLNVEDAPAPDAEPEGFANAVRKPKRKNGGSPDA
jgi:hypothetical protein